MPDPATPVPAPAVPTATVPRTRDHPIEIEVRHEFVRMAYAELATGTFASLGAALALAVAVGFTTGSTAAFWWFGVMAAIAAGRLWLARAFPRAQPESRDHEHWGLRFIIATTLTAAGWGATPWLFPVLHHGGVLGLAHMLMMAGIVTGSARVLLPMRKGSLAYLLAMMTPLAARFFADGTLEGSIVGVCVVLFVLYMASATAHNHRTLSDALVMRFEREAITIELRAENTRREAREAELQEAREKAESANKAKDEFIATISHEIRTPMNGVLGMLRVVRDTELSPEQRSYLRTASDSAESLLLLLNDVLDFSKIEAGRLEIERAPFPPATVAKSVADLLLARARDKGLQFDLRLGDNLPGAVIGDSGRVRQILVNLLGNAIKFTERGRIELAVTCVERSESRAVMQFVVTDSGIGIDSAALDRLFKPFTQADSSMSRRYGGTGLGLVISLRLAQAMGGIIQVQSTPNRGSTFQLVLPCPLPEFAAAAAPRPAETPRFVSPLLKGRVLVVEDDTVNRQVIDLFLKKIGLTPTFAPDGEGAITTALAQPFDLVLMDCQLPGIDGLEATRRIRQQLDGKPLTIIALTANASTQVRENCLAAGMNDFLSKPVRFELLAGVLQKHLPAA